jgi:HAE1 family hydrophobic/amphiphilic exporter-1
VSISSLYIQRPVTTTLVMLSIVLFGVIGYRLLPVSDLPNVDFPTIMVTATYPGANPDTMASAIATPLEKEFSTIAGIDSMSSSSSQGSMTVSIQFVLSRNIDAAAQDVQAAIARAARNLPTDLPAPPSYRKVNPADYPFFYMSLTSPNLPMSDLDELGENLLAQRISMVDGVAQVMVYGSQKYAVRIEVSPLELAARGIGIDEVATAVTNQNVNLPLGTLYGPNKVSVVEANGQLMRAEQYMPLVVAYHNGQPTRLRDIGTAVDSVENDKTAAWFYNGKTLPRAIILAVQRQPGTNTVEVARAVKELLPQFRDKMPASVALEVFRDNSLIIEESFNDVQFTLVLTLALVIMVIFLFLRNFWATVIPSITLPVSIIGTFAVMYALNYSLDNLSLMALTLSIGFVVDDAIVMLENIVRHMEMGKTRLQAAYDGAKEIGFTIVSMTLSLTAVFLPVMFMSGIVGRLFREFAVCIGVAVLVSGFVSLTLTPMMCSRFLKDPRRIHHGLMYRLTEAGFQGMLKVYDWTLGVALTHKLVTLLMALGVLGASIWLLFQVPLGFIPSEDQGQVMVQTEASQDVSFEAMVAYQQKLAAIARQDPNVQRFFDSAGARGSWLGNNGTLFLTLKKRKPTGPGEFLLFVEDKMNSVFGTHFDTTRGTRELSADQVINEIRPKFASVPGIRCFPSNPPPINVGARMSRALYQITLQSLDVEQLYRYAGELENKLRAKPEFQDVSSDLQLKNPQLNLKIDRDKAMTMGVTAMQIETALDTAYSYRQVSTILSPSNQYQVIVQLLPKFQTDPSVLSMLYVRSSGGQLVPMQSLTSTSENLGPLQINHSGQQISVTVSFNLKTGVSLGQAVDMVNEINRQSMPVGVTCTPQGSTQAFLSSVSSMGILLILAVLVIYIVLGILYESFYHPLTILSALPFAGFGALLTLYIFHAELSIYAMVGMVMLIGLVKKNGIMMVDFALEVMRTGKTPTQAIHEACLIRFRPIMMTTMAALMAGIPIALGYGAGGESRQPLGLAVVGGLLFSQSLTLYVTPVVFVCLEWLANFLKQALALRKSRRSNPGDGEDGNLEFLPEEAGIESPPPLPVGVAAGEGNG